MRLSALKEFQNFCEAYGCVAVCVNAHVVSKNAALAVALVVGGSFGVDVAVQGDGVAAFSVPAHDGVVEQNELMAARVAGGDFEIVLLGFENPRARARRPRIVMVAANEMHVFASDLLA